VIATLMGDIAHADMSYNTIVLYPSICNIDFEKVRCHLSKEITKSSTRQTFPPGALLSMWQDLLSKEATSIDFVLIDDDEPMEEVSLSDAAADAQYYGEEELQAILHPVSRLVLSHFARKPWVQSKLLTSFMFSCCCCCRKVAVLIAV
jgi:hypothetical protein